MSWGGDGTAALPAEAVVVTESSPAEWAVHWRPVFARVRLLRAFLAREKQQRRGLAGQLGSRKSR